MTSSLTLVLPPLTQLNTPYPSTAYLAQFLREHGIACRQRDLGIELVSRLFSAQGLEEIFDELEQKEELPEPAWRALSDRRRHVNVVESVLDVLRGRESGLAARILSTPFLPMGPRLEKAQVSAFGRLGSDDAARYLATLYLEDLADLITACIDPGFAITRYHHHLAASAHTFEPLIERLAQTTLVDRHLDELADSLEGDVVGLSVPFPGNFYGALRIGRRLKARGAMVLMGGGYINTELRDVTDARLWDYIDALTYDDGEGPLLAILEHRAGKPDRRHRTRTAQGVVDCKVKRPPMTPAGTYGDLNLGAYLQTIDTLNPAHRIWGEGRWNKMTLAHGCYWKQCSFCDVNLDYIGHYEKSNISRLVDHIERLIAETGQRGFHFVDEAAPPKMLEGLAIELLARGVAISYWGNIRFEKSYTPDLCRLLAASGLIAVTGGLEVADDRLLKLINKGVTVDQVTHAAAAFRDAGVMVHAYLMYGFPTQTQQETVDSMEIVRQLFAAKLIDSAFWHRFVLTRHAPLFADATRHGLLIDPGHEEAFARNDVQYREPGAFNHDLFDTALPTALESWLRGRDLDVPVNHWLAPDMPKPKVPPGRIRRALASKPKDSGRRLLWLGPSPLSTPDTLVLHGQRGRIEMSGTPSELEWMEELLAATVPGEPELTLAAAQEVFPGDWNEFATRWQVLREAGLVCV
jgi:radical SAM superfamily enzyme YgiQ (UPF0313 family)